MRTKNKNEVPAWQSKDGTKTPVTLMTTRHIENTIKYLADRQSKAEMSFVFGPSSRGDMASYYEGHAAEDDLSKAAFCAHWIKILTNELKRRSRESQNHKR